MNGFYGECLRLEIFGQSHAESVGMTLEGVPAGARVDLDALLRFMQRRAPGRSEYATARREADVLLSSKELLSEAGYEIDAFGASAPYKVLFKEYGFTPENVARLARKTLNK